jgi:FAD/FMN-containing dehydrogenase
MGWLRNPGHLERAQAMGGTRTGVHGTGRGRQKYLTAEIGPEAIGAMRALKQALDPPSYWPRSERRAKAV